MENFHPIIQMEEEKKRASIMKIKKMVGGLPGMVMDIKCLKRFIKMDWKFLKNLGMKMVQEKINIPKITQKEQI